MIRRTLLPKPISVLLVIAIVVSTLTWAIPDMSTVLASPGSLDSVTQPSPPADQRLLSDIELVLLDYSKALSSGQVVQGNYTPVMRELVQERRAFYKEYFEIGLHSTLNSV